MKLKLLCQLVFLEIWVESNAYWKDREKAGDFHHCAWLFLGQESSFLVTMGWYFHKEKNSMIEGQLWNILYWNIIEGRSWS